MIYCIASFNFVNHLHDNQEQARAEENATEAIKYAIIKGWSLSKVKEAESQPLKQKTVCMMRPKKKAASVGSGQKQRGKGSVDHIEETIFYEPDVPDLSKVGMGVELLVSHILVYRFQFHAHICCAVQALAERMAENAHNRWSLQLKREDSEWSLTVVAFSALL